MDKPRFESPDITAASIEKLAALFPGVVADGKVNFDLLRSMLGDEVAGDEAYEFTWVGKKAAIAEAGRPIRKTLRPCPEESKNWDTTENLYIEGDNLDVLKLLQESYLGKIKMIYIDPPYNTGNDFVYRDNFTQDKDEYEQEAGAYDKDGDRLFRNTESNGRFHSDWCSMLFPRLVLARNLLKDDGVIFISIGDNELANIAKISNEVFGEANKIVIFSRMMKSGGAKGQFYTPNIDYVLTYAKNINSTQAFRSFLTDDQIGKFYNKTENEGPRIGEIYGEERIYKASLDPRPNQRYYIKCPDGTYVIPPGISFPKRVEEGEKVHPTSEDGVWKWIYDRYSSEYRAGNIVFKYTGTSALVNERGEKSNWNLYNKLWLIEQQEKGVVPSNFISEFENRQSSAELKSLAIPFDFAKPINLLVYLSRILKISSNDIILDFFSGSATTAHAVMQLNAVDSLKRKFILVQLPEPCSPDSEASKAGYTNICEIGKERIRRAGEKIKAEAGLMAQNLDIGFRVLKLDSTNMLDVYYGASEYTQGMLSMMEDNIKDDRTDMDLLYGCLLDWGLPLSMPHAHELLDGYTIHTYNDGDLIACFDKHINDSVIKEIARRCGSKERKGLATRAVFRDSSFISSPDKINVEEIFKLLAPNTSVRVI